MHKTCFTALLAGALGLAASSPVLASETCSARSPAHRVGLLELYTSEGCSSCPPADRWLSGLRQQPGVGEQFVPLALHVDYWDDIGWKDIYAQSRFGHRQRDLVAAAGSTVVYTPQFFLQGKSVRPDRSAGLLATELAALAQRPAVADIVLTQSRSGPRQLALKVEANLHAESGGQPASLFIALYQNGLQTQVKAGENSGATLRHDFVVRLWSGPKAIPASGKLAETVVFTLPGSAPASDFGVAAFVQRGGNEVLQALARPVCV